MADFDFQQPAQAIQELLNSIPNKAEQVEVEQLQSDVETLRALYEALQQSAPVIIQPSDTWPVASPEEGVIYRVIDRTNTPPQYYSDYMWNGSTMVQMAQYSNAIDDVPTAGSNNLVKSGGVKDSILDLVSPDNLFDQTKLKEGYYVESTNGIEYAVEGYGYLYINVEAETLYVLSRDRINVAFFNASNNYISGKIAYEGQPFATPSGCAKMTVSILLSERANFCVFEGSTLYAVKDPKVIDDRSLKLDSILPESVNREKFSLAYASRNVGKNLYDKDSQEIVRGYYVNALSGQIEPNASFCYLSIPCLPGTQYTLQGDGSSLIAFFDVLQQYISGVLYKGTFTTPANCSYMMVSVAIANLDKIQLEIGASATEYLPYQLCIPNDSIPYRSITELYLTPELTQELRRNGRIITVGTGKDYTTVLAALQDAEEGDTIVLDSGVYDIEQEYKDAFGSDYFDEYSTNYNQDNPAAGWFNLGLYIGKGISLIGNGNVTISFPWSGENTNVKTYFSILNPTADNTIKNITIEAGNGNCRYHIHDDWAGDSASMCGVNIMENIVFKGTTFYSACIGGGMGIGNTYIVKDCIFLSSDATSISYHNSVNGAAENCLYITNCYCNGKIIVLSYGSSTKITYCSIKGNRCTEIIHSKTTQESEDNTVIFDWGNVISN